MTQDNRPIKNVDNFGPMAKMALEYINNYVEYIRYELDLDDRIARARTMQLVIILNSLQEELLAKISGYYELENLPEARFTEDGDTCMAIRILNQRMDEIKDSLSSLVMASRTIVEIGESFLIDGDNISELEALRIKKTINEINAVIEILSGALKRIETFEKKR